jgi:large subunit ribosomal protein L10
MAEKYGKKVKQLMVQEMKDVFTKNKGFVFASVENLKASDVDVFRKEMRGSGSRYLVLKNKLAGRALDEAGIDGLGDTVSEQKVMGVGLIKEDPVVIAKIMTEFAKKNKGFNVSRGYLDGRVMETERIQELADLPGREQLIATVVSMMNSPISGFAGVLSSVLRSVLYALNAVKEEKEKTA